MKKDAMPAGRQGLTLVELLIVIAIIGLLSSMLAINIGKWRARARDSQRVADVKTVQQGLAFYFFRSENAGSYPIGDVDITGSDFVSQELRANGAMSAIPVDPINEGNYVYHYCSLETCTTEPDGDSYYIKYYLETNSIQGKSPGQNLATP